MTENPSQSDRYLLQKYINEKDEAAFAIFYFRYNDILWKQAVSKLGSQQAAEEICANFFYKFIDRLFKKPDFINDIFKHNKNSALPYMMNMIRNSSIDFHREQQRKNHREATLDSQQDDCTPHSQKIDLPDLQNQAETELFEIRHDFSQIIRRKVRQLKEKLTSTAHMTLLERKRLEKNIVRSEHEASQLEIILELLYVNNMSCTEVSKIVGIDRKTLQSRRKHLEVVLTDYLLPNSTNANKSLSHSRVNHYG